MRDSNHSVTYLTFLRHGESEGGDIYRGSTDVPLTPLGRQQMEASIGTEMHWDRVVSSPLVRCLDYSLSLAERHALPVEVVEDLREIHFGAWEGQSISKMTEAYPELTRKFYREPAIATPPGGESVPLAARRAVAALEVLLQAYHGDDILVVSHGGIIRLLMCHYLDMPLSAFARLHLPYATVVKFQIHHHGGDDFPVLTSLFSGSALV